MKFYGPSNRSMESTVYHIVWSIRSNSTSAVLIALHFPTNSLQRSNYQYFNYERYRMKFVCFICISKEANRKSFSRLSNLRFAINFLSNRNFSMRLNGNTWTYLKIIRELIEHSQITVQITSILKKFNDNVLNPTEYRRNEKRNNPTSARIVWNKIARVRR